MCQFYAYDPGRLGPDRRPLSQQDRTMRKAFGIILGILAAAVLGVLALAATKPDHFSVTRSITITAPAEKIFPLMNSPKAAMAWIPFLEPDPDVKITYSGPESGKGAAQDWDGNSEVGTGRIEVVDQTPPTRVTLKLDMVRPMEGHNTVIYALDAQGAGTKVTWTMSGEQPFLAKIVSVLIDCDKMVGDQFEKGLAKLRGVAEKA